MLVRGERACLANVSGTTECIFRLMFLEKEAWGVFFFPHFPAFPLLTNRPG